MVLAGPSRSHLRHHFFAEKLPGFQGEAGTAIGSPNRLEGKSSLYSCGARELATVPWPLEAKHKSPCVLYGHEASMWEAVSRAEANCLGKKEEVTRKRRHSVQSSSCMLLA